MPNAPVPIFIMYIFFIWTVFWVGVALWRSAHFHQRNWFIAILLLNFSGLTTLGILEFIYLFRFSKKRLTIEEIKSWKNVFMKKVPDDRK